MRLSQVFSRLPACPEEKRITILTSLNLCATQLNLDSHVLPLRPIVPSEAPPRFGRDDDVAQQ
jgi:hypothetical protein